MDLIKDVMIRILFFLFPVFLSAQNSQFDLFFDEADALFGKFVIDGKVDYQNIKAENATASLVDIMSRLNIKGLDNNSRKAFLINAYNIAVIDKIVKLYPIQSVQEKGDFFDQKNISIGSRRVSLNMIEKEMLLGSYDDPRIHFALVCGAVSCAPLRKTAYRSEDIEIILDQQIKEAINSHRFVNVLGGSVYLSKLFDWYQDDFGGINGIITYLNSKRTKSIALGKTIKFLPYDWTLNGYKMDHINVGTNANRYVVSSTIPKGQWEVKWFNNLYSQKQVTGSNEDRASYLTSSLSVLFGVSKRWNLGLNTRYRAVKLEQGNTNPLHIFDGGESKDFRKGLTALGPQIRVAPFPRWNNFSIQSSFVFAVGDSLSGSSNQPFIDWDGASWYTQLFNDYAIGDKFSLFTEADMIIEGIGKNNQFSTPITIILSYFPIKNVTVYGLTGYSPIWTSEYDYFYQLGMGFKYQFSPHYELEILVTDFTNKYLKNNNGSAATYNMGMRMNLF